MSLSKISVNNTQIVGVDDEPTAGSEDLVKSGGVSNAIKNSKNEIITNASDSFDISKITIRDKCYFNGTELVQNNVLYTIVIDISEYIDCDVYFTDNPPYSIGAATSIPATYGEVVLAASTSETSHFSTRNANYLIMSHYPNKDIKVVLNGDYLLSFNNDGYVVPSGSQTSVNRLRGELVTNETMLEGDVLPKLNQLISNVNLLDPEKITPGYFQANSGKVYWDKELTRIAEIPNVVLDDWYCLSASQDLSLSPDYADGVGVYVSGLFLCSRNKDNYGTLHGSPDIEIVLQPDTHGFKIRVPDLHMPVTLYISVGLKAGTELQFEKGETPTSYVPYGQPSGVDYTLINQLQRDINSLRAQIDNVKSVPSRWAGCRYMAFGDSITDERYEPNRKYTTMISEALSCSSYVNNAQSGMTMARNGVNDNDFISKINNYDYNAFDLITFMFGTNDCGYNVPIGTLGSVDENTFIGAYSKAIKTIIGANPTIRIVLFTIFQTRDVRNNDGTPGQGVDYNDAIKAIGQYFSIPVIDVWGESGLTIENASTLTDGWLHPNAAGHEFAGGYIVAQIKNL